MHTRCWRKNCLLLTVLIMALAHSGRAAGNKGAGLSFIRQQEPNEGAFSILVPQGWQSKGGIFRVNPLQAGGPLNALAAKCDLTLQSDGRATVSFRILPDIVYAYAGIGGGFFPPGANYQGATVRRLEDAPTHLRSLFSVLRPGATGVKVLKLQRLPGEIRSLDQGTAYTNQLLMQIGGQAMTVRHDAAGGVFEYTESEVRYREVLLTGIVDSPAALTWNNTRTLAFRAPAAEFARWRPVMDIMRFSIRFNPQWILKESQGQQERAEIVRKVFDEVRRLDREIVLRTTINREEIMNDNFLVLTEQEEYVNPHTNEVEMDTDAFRYRWVTPGNDVYYTDREDEDPNTFLQRTDYKRTPVRKRRNE
jgi:hypothetical protein